MSQKRNRSTNWDEEEKQLFRLILKEYTPIIENKSLETNTLKIKNKAWEEVHRKFNKVNGRLRNLSQLKIQWKSMKSNARKSKTTATNESNGTEGQARPPTSTDDEYELLRDQNIYDSDSDGVILSPSANEVGLESTSETSTVTSQDIKPIRNIEVQLGTCEKNCEMEDHIGYANSLMEHSKILKETEFKRRMEMAEQEHQIKMAIQKEKLTCAILEREILEIKKMREEKNFNI